MNRILALALALVTIMPARAHYKPEYAQASPEMKEYFNSLHNENHIPCCDTSDGRRIDDADWDLSCTTNPVGLECHYRVRIEGEWYDIPNEALVTGLPAPKDDTRGAIVWPVPQGKGYYIRCFRPGSGA